MERRREPRIRCKQLVWLTVFAENEVRCRATTVDVSAGGMKLLTAWRFPQDAAVQIELQDVIYLGEICYCRPEPGGFIIGIEINMAVRKLSDLIRLQRKLEGAGRKALSEHLDTTGRDKEQGQLRDLDCTRL